MNVEEDLRALRKDLIKQCIIAIPTSIVTGAAIWLQDTFLLQPWHSSLIIIPLIIIAFLIWRKIIQSKQYKIKGLFLWFFAAYILIFSIAAGTRLLDGKTTLVGYKKSLPRNWFSLNWTGDWRYRIVPKKPLDAGFLVIMMERTPNESLENKRFKLIRLIKLAKEEEARGIVFDFYFKNNSNIDLLFCQALDTASENKLKILVGFDFEIVKGKFCRGAVAKNLKGSLPKANQGHLMGYGEWDGKIRSLPLFFKNDTTLPALSYKLAEHVSKVKGPKSRLLQFIKPSEDPIILDYEELVFNKENWPLVRDRYLLVGEKSLRDRFSTPFGETAGVLIHAYAAHSLIENHYIKRVSWISYFLTIFIFCFLLTVWFVHGVSIKGLFVRNILFSVILFLIAVFLICFALIWFEIIYSLVAIWVYLPLLIGLKKITN